MARSRQGHRTRRHGAATPIEAYMNMHIKTYRSNTCFDRKLKEVRREPTPCKFLGSGGYMTMGMIMAIMGKPL